MSHSFKKHPFCGIGGWSDQWDKRKANRKLRRRVHIRLHTEDFDRLPGLREVSDVWCFNKDGKYLFDPVDWPKGMRK